jgi:hypothetical protein
MNIISPLRDQIARVGGHDIGEPAPAWFLKPTCSQRGAAVSVANVVEKPGIPIVSVALICETGVFILYGFGGN